MGKECNIGSLGRKLKVLPRLHATKKNNFYMTAMPTCTVQALTEQSYHNQGVALTNMFSYQNTLNTILQNRKVIQVEFSK